MQKRGIGKELLQVSLTNQFQQILPIQFSNQKNTSGFRKSKITVTEEEKREKGTREIEEMLGLRGGDQQSRLPKIKISNREEVELERKIGKIKKINRNRTIS